MGPRVLYCLLYTPYDKHRFLDVKETPLSVLVNGLRVTPSATFVLRAHEVHFTFEGSHLWYGGADGVEGGREGERVFK